MLRTDRARIWDAIDQIKFLDGDGVYLVQSVYHGDITPTLSLQNVDQVINRCIAADRDISGRNLVFAHYSLDLLHLVSGRRAEMVKRSLHRGLCALAERCW